VHPGGPYHRHKDAGAWTIPKGLINEGEDMLAGAWREFEEELGSKPVSSAAIPLTPVKQKGGKTVYAWAARGNFDTGSFVSNTFRMEYPYRSGKWIEVPEVDRAEWFSIPEARLKINPAQEAFLDELLVILEKS